MSEKTAGMAANQALKATARLSKNATAATKKKVKVKINVAANKAKSPKSTKTKLISVSTNKKTCTNGSTTVSHPMKRPCPTRDRSSADESIERCKLAISSTGRVRIRK